MRMLQQVLARTLHEAELQSPPRNVVSGLLYSVKERRWHMVWGIWAVIAVILTIIDKRLLLPAAIIFGIGLGLKWW
jgi:hypothetical protein